MDLEETIQKIMAQKEISREEIKAKIDEQIKELSGLIDEEGAIVIVAKNLGVDLKENQAEANLEADTPIEKLTPNKNASVVGRLVQIGNVRTFSKKDGSEGSLLPFVLEDKTGMIRCIAWGQVQTQISNEQGFSQGEIMRVVNGYVKIGKTGAQEMHIGSKSRMQLQPDNVDLTMLPKKEKEQIRITALNDITLGIPFVNIETLISGVFEPKPFNRKDGSQGRRGSIRVQDENREVYITFWGDHCEKMKNVSQGQFVQITHLTPKPNYRDKTKIDLTATTNTIITPITPADSNTPLNVQADPSKPIPIKNMVESGGYGNIEGKIQEIEENRIINTKDGRELALMKIIVADETGAIRMNLWGDKADPSIQVNAVYLFENVSVRKNDFSNEFEATLTRLGTIVPSKKTIQTSHTIVVKPQRSTSQEINIEEINQSEFYSVRATIIKDITRITTYRACSNCNKKTDNCTCENPGESVNRMILNVTLDDETGILRGTLMGERAEKFLDTSTDRIVQLSDAGELEQFLKRKNLELVGREFQFRGRTRYSDYTNSYEMNINSYEELDPKEEIQRIFALLD